MKRIFRLALCQGQLPREHTQALEAPAPPTCTSPAAACGPAPEKAVPVMGPATTQSPQVVQGKGSALEATSPGEVKAVEAKAVKAEAAEPVKDETLKAVKAEADAPTPEVQAQTGEVDNSGICVGGQCEEDHNPDTEVLLHPSEVSGAPWDLAKGVPMPPNDAHRRDTAKAMGLFDAPKCVELDYVLETLCRIFDSPYASIALYYNRCCWLANVSNMVPGRMTWCLAACPWNTLVKQPQTIVCGELLEDARFRHQPWTKAGLRCYCSAPLLASNGHRMGTICFMDTVPRDVDVGMCRVLNNFGEIAVRILERHLKLVKRLEAVQQHAPQQLQALMHAAASGAPMRRQDSQGAAIQGPDAGFWDNPNGNGSRAVSRRNTVDLEGHGEGNGNGKVLRPADQLLASMFTRQLRHLEALNACVLVIDTSKPGWPVMYADETWSVWSGYSRGDILGQRLSDILRSSAPGVAPLNWEALQAQADAHERFVLPGLMACRPQSLVEPHTMLTSDFAGAAAALEAAGIKEGVGAGKLAHNVLGADGATTYKGDTLIVQTPEAPVAVEAVTVHTAGRQESTAHSISLSRLDGLSTPPMIVSQDPQAALAATSAASNAHVTSSAEMLIEQVSALEQQQRHHNDSHSVSFQPHEAAGELYSTQSALSTQYFKLNPVSSSAANAEGVLGNSGVLAGGTPSAQMPCNTSVASTSGPFPSGTTALTTEIPSSSPYCIAPEKEGQAAGKGSVSALPGGKPFDLSFRPMALDVLDEDALPLGVPSWVPMEACEPVLRLYVVRLHESMSLPPPPAPLTPSLKVVGKSPNSLSELAGFLFPGLGLEHVLGRGGYGTAYLGSWHDVNVVVKVQDHKLKDMDALRQAQLEISLGQMLRHPNLVRTLGHGAVELPQQDAATAGSVAGGSALTSGVESKSMVAEVEVEEPPDLFEERIAQWLGKVDKEGDYFDDSRWFSRCDSMDVYRRDMASNVSGLFAANGHQSKAPTLPPPQLMINAASVCADIQPSLFTSGSMRRQNTSGNSGKLGKLAAPDGMADAMVCDTPQPRRFGTQLLPMEIIAEEQYNSQARTTESGLTNVVASMEHATAASQASAVQRGAHSSVGPQDLSASTTNNTQFEGVLPAGQYQQQAVVPGPEAAVDANGVVTSNGTEDEMMPTTVDVIYQPAASHLTDTTFPPTSNSTALTGAEVSSKEDSLLHCGLGSAQSEDWAAVLTAAQREGQQAAQDAQAPPANNNKMFPLSPAKALAADSNGVLPAAQQQGGAGAKGGMLTSAPQGGFMPLSVGTVNSANSVPASASGWGGRSSGKASTEVTAILKEGEAHAAKVKAKPLTFPLKLRTFAILEFCDGGTLLDAIDRGWLRSGVCEMSSPPNMVKVVQLSVHVAKGVAFLHSRGVVHADLSANNILLCKVHHTASRGKAAKLQGGAAPEGAQPEAAGAKEGPGLYTLPIKQYSLAPPEARAADEMQFVAKVSDLGQAVLLGPEGIIKVASYATVTHQAPEVLKDKVLSTAADVYAVGVLMWQMYTGSRPWPSLDHRQIYSVVTAGAISLEWPDPAAWKVAGAHQAVAARYIALGQRCVAYKPEERPSMEEVEAEMVLLQEELRGSNTPQGSDGGAAVVQPAVSKEGSVVVGASKEGAAQPVQVMHAC